MHPGRDAGRAAVRVWSGHGASRARWRAGARWRTRGPAQAGASSTTRTSYGCLGACAGQELRDDARLLREARLADLSVVQAVPTQQANAFSAPPPEQAAALAAASPATLLAAEVRT